MTNELELLKKQEDLLQFEHFTNDDAYELGKFMAKRAKQQRIAIALSIRMNSGYIAFQYGPTGTNLLNQKWMERKFNSVRLMERSSLATYFTWERDGDTLETHGLKAEDYAVCGGGFPIRIKGSTDVIGAIIASNLYHIADHEFITGCLREYLNVPDVPSIPYSQD